jgi:DNA repair protein RecN (Recombination protein N)
MIREIGIKNVALIDAARISLHEGFTVLTGETGAGKSILVGAISLLLGERASSESIRGGTDEAEVDGIFELAAIAPGLAAICLEAHIPCEDNTFIIRRSLSRNGRNRVYVNQVPVPLTTLKQLGDHLVDLHGQHEHQSLLNPLSAYAIIDALPAVQPAAETYTTAYLKYTVAEDALAAFDAKAAQLEARRDLIDFQHKEIAGLQLKPGDELELEHEYTLLSSVAERLQCIAAINTVIDGSDTSAGLTVAIGLIQKKLEALLKFDSQAGPWINQVDGMQALVAELSLFCSRYLSDSEATANPARLDEINDRLAKIQRLKKKYHCSPDELLDKQRQLADDLASLQNLTADRSHYVHERDRALKECLAAGGMLSAARRGASAKFDRAVSKLMADLGFTDGRWRTTLTATGSPAPTGCETIVFDVQTNPGEAFLPLAKTASGGEISRLMLAVKSIMANNDRIPVLIFDEIDTGIGGHIATEVGHALQRLADTHQVICISHLHQIASLARHHYRVFKTNQAGRTLTRVQELTGAEKVEEIARMLGSDTALGRKHAEELLNRS